MTDDLPALLPLITPGEWVHRVNVVVCNGCGSIVLANDNAKAVHLDWHRKFLSR